MIPSTELLRREANMIHRAVFRVPLFPKTEARFIEASMLLNQTQNRAENAHYYRIIQNLSDLEALEVACRYTRKLPQLSQKFRLMLHIAETRPEVQTFLINECQSSLKAWISITVGLVQTAHKITKGFFLLRHVRNA